MGNSLRYLVFLGFCCVVLAACNRMRTPTTEVTPTPVSTAQPETHTEGEFIVSAVESGAPLRCQIQRSSDTTDVSIIVHGRRAKATGVRIAQEKKGTVLSDGSTIYLWNDGETTGVKTSLPSPEDVRAFLQNARGAGIDVPDLTNPATYTTLEQEGYVIDCKEESEETIPDDTFASPQAVQFTDVTTLVTNVITMVKNRAPSPLPSATGTPIPTPEVIILDYGLF